MRKLTNFEVGDKVWIERTEFVENVDLICNPQIIERIMDVPVVLDTGEEVYIQSIDIKGSDFMYIGEELRKAD